MYYILPGQMPQSRHKQLIYCWATPASAGWRQEVETMKIANNLARSRRILGAVAALALTGAALSGCVYYPNRYAYNGYYGGGYYAPAPVVVAPVVVGGWWGWGGGWHGRGCCWR
jgi:hypothetical protein